MRKVAILSIAVVGEILYFGRYLLRNKKICFKIQKTVFFRTKSVAKVKDLFYFAQFDYSL